MAKRRAGAGVGAVVTTVVGTLLGWGGVARAEKPRISVAPVAGERAPAELRERFARSLAEGLMASGADIAPAATEAPYVLRGTLEVEGRSYALHLEMVDRKTGVIVASREDRCEICTEAEAFETANTAASTLKALVFKRPATSALPARTFVAPMPAPTPPTASGPAVASVELAPTAPPPARHRGLGWVGVAGGIVSGGVGALLIGIDGRGTCGGAPAVCPEQYETRWVGIGLVAVGVAALGAGVLAILGKL